MKNTLLAIIALIGLSYSAHAQLGVIPRYGTTIGATNVAAGFSTNLTTAGSALYKGRGLALWFLGNHTNAPAVTNCVIDLQVSYDGTAWAQPSGFSWSAAPNGSWQTTNFPASLLDNYKVFRINTITNQDTSSMLFITNVVWSASP